MEKLINDVIDWANEKDILKPENQFKQLAKVDEEWSETMTAILCNDKEEIIDGIGDTIVTLIILCSQTRLNFQDIMDAAFMQLRSYSAYDEKDILIQISILKGKVSEALLKKKDIGGYVAEIISHLILICEIQRTRLSKCLGVAYNEIKD